jgi:hypothetical protein
MYINLVNFLKFGGILATKNLKKDFTTFNHIAFWLYIYSQQKEVDACIHSKNQKSAMAPHENGHMFFTYLVRNTLLKCNYNMEFTIGNRVFLKVILSSPCLWAYFHPLYFFERGAQSKEILYNLGMKC